MEKESCQIDCFVECLPEIDKIGQQLFLNLCVVQSHNELIAKHVVQTITVLAMKSCVTQPGLKRTYVLVLLSDASIERPSLNERITALVISSGHYLTNVLESKLLQIIIGLLAY
ncbi:hypothetical protein RF11_05907 [Thelohanellus kitauei]|uniref:Uncharacterized protein n=1 Tax=Thelohanellus kitauei TaxID=669202 RepID=A0A0C2IWT1_THEKT|nr:hypothetical protein RF11_05907 [Thelohanellus kitauei]